MTNFVIFRECRGSPSDDAELPYCIGISGIYLIYGGRTGAIMYDVNQGIISFIRSYHYGTEP